MLKDSQDRYGIVSRIMHWAMALLIGLQLLKFFDRINDGEHWVGETLVPTHVSFGSLLLVLIVLRILWGISQRNQRPEQDPASAKLVKAGHGMLYLGMLLMPITGVSIMLGNGYGLTVFGTELVARGTDIPWAASLGSLHSPLSWALALLIFGHIGMALLHHFVHKDDTLKRMA